MKSLSLLTFLALVLSTNAWGRLKKVDWNQFVPWKRSEKTMGESHSDALCFDLNANGGSGPGNEETDCRIYVRNNKFTNTEKGISRRSWKRWKSDCIDLKNPSRYSFTDVWTTCDDALWIDEMYLGVGYCAKDHDSNGCQRYGKDDRKGWCLSTDPEDAEGWEKYLTTGGCHRMLRLGRPGLKEGTVEYFDGKVARRHLTGADGSLEELTQKVKDCEAQGFNCERLADKVFDLFDSIPAEEWVSDGQGERSAVQELDGHCDSVVADYEKEIRALGKTLADLEEKVEKEEEITSLRKKLSLLEQQTGSGGRLRM